MPGSYTSFRHSIVDREADHDIRFFELIRKHSPNFQPWRYCEWVEKDRNRPTDKGTVRSSQMKKLYPALTWEESMAAMLLYVEELQLKIGETYKEGKKPRVLPSSIAMGWIRNMIDKGKFGAAEPGSFYPLLFSDGVHPNINGGYLVDCEEGTTAVATPAFAPVASALGQVTPVTLTSPTPGAWFRYTLDGTTPTRTKGYVYCGVISVRPGMTVKAVAFKSGMADSAVVEANFAKK